MSVDNDSQPYFGENSLHLENEVSSSIPPFTMKETYKLDNYNASVTKVKTNGQQHYTAELDVICRICGDKASGFHYGVHSCEGCKSFFRRTMKKKLVYGACQKGKRCIIDTISRKKCQACRLQRCLNAGMSINEFRGKTISLIAVRMGRMRKTEREKLVADVEELSSISSQRIVALQALSDHIKAAFKHFFRDSNVTTTDRKEKWDDIENGKIMIKRLHSRDFHNYSIFINYQRMIIPLMKAAVKFAKRIPSFTSLSLDNQIKLMKEGTLAVAVLMIHELIGEDIIKLQGSEGELEIERSAICQSVEAASLLSRAILVSDRLRKIQLSKGEMALFCAIVLITETPDTETLGAVLMDLIQSFRIELKHNHPKNKYVFPSLLVLISDLRLIVDEFRENLRKNKFSSSDDYSSVLPFIKEIFDIH